MNPKLGNNRGRLNNGLAHRLWRAKAVGHTGVTRSIRKSIKTGRQKQVLGECLSEWRQALEMGSYYKDSNPKAKVLQILDIIAQHQDK